MSAITYAELEYGVAASADPAREQANLTALAEDIRVAPFDAAAGAAYEPIRLATRETKRDHLDKLIAAHAVSLGVTLITYNIGDFAEYPGVRAENWLTAGGNH
jgi:tRNA(fMet)-specific endonuclease VapC